MSFRLWTVFYVFALTAAAMATFGPWGLVPATLVLGFWAWAFYAPMKRLTAVELLVLTVVIGTLAALLLPSVQVVRESSRHGECMNNTKQLALALLSYEAKTGALPPAFIESSTGQPLLSWRVLVLPFVDRKDVFELFDLHEAWDNPVNSKSSSASIELFHCPNDPTRKPTTNYFAIIGPRTAWHGNTGRRLADIPDGATQTVLLMEAIGKNVPWSKPDDLSIDEAVELLSSTREAIHTHYGSDGFFYRRFDQSPGINVAMADGSVRFLRLPLPKDLAIALLTADGGEQGLLTQLDYYSRPQIDYSKVYAFSAFVFISLLPAAWLKRTHA
jgi:prepilin-type processing-associated H-X9-DG protein